MKLVRTLMVCLGLTVVFASGASYQEPGANPTFGGVKLKAGFEPDPFTKELIAGGEIKTDKGGVMAHVAKVPDFILNYEAGKFTLTIYAESKSDTTLLIKTPDDKWVANDDGPGTGLNPLIRFENPKSGRYAIFVGTFGPEPAKAVLKISELKVGN